MAAHDWLTDWQYLSICFCNGSFVRCPHCYYWKGWMWPNDIKKQSRTKLVKLSLSPGKQKDNLNKRGLYLLLNDVKIHVSELRSRLSIPQKWSENEQLTAQANQNPSFNHFTVRKLPPLINTECSSMIIFITIYLIYWLLNPCLNRALDEVQEGYIKKNRYTYSIKYNCQKSIKQLKSITGILYISEYAASGGGEEKLT